MRKKSKGNKLQSNSRGNNRKMSLLEQEDRAARGVYKIKKSKRNKKSISRGNKRKKSKVEQEDRAGAGVISLRRIKWNKKTEQQQGLYEKEE